MPLQFDIWSALMIMGITQGLILLVASIFRKSPRYSQRIIVTLIIIVTFALIEFLLLSSAYYTQVPHLIYTSSPLLFLIGPLLYFLVRDRLNEPVTFDWRSMWHLTPFIFALLMHAPWYFETAEAKINMLELSMISAPRGFGVKAFVYPFVQISQVVIYMTLSLRAISKHFGLNEATPSRISTQLRGFIRVFFIYWSLQLIGLIYIAVFKKYIFEIDYVLALLNSIGISSLALILLNNREKSTGKKYSKTTLDETQYREILQGIERLIIEETYLNPDLTLSDFATSLNSNKNYISRVINEEFGVNFNEYINGYRIQRAQKLLISNHERLKLLAVAMESGFNNKTSFNRAFRKHIGMTPSDFQKQNIPQESLKEL